MIQNFISKLSLNEKRVLYIAAALVVVAILDRVFLGPVTSRLNSLEEEIDQEKSVIKRDQRFLSYKDKILSENKEFSPYFANPSQTQEEIIAAFLKKIEMLASESKVNLARVTPAGSQQKTGYMEHYADLECDGELENISKFMYAIETSPDLLKIIKINISPKKAGSSEVRSTMTITKMIIDASAPQFAAEFEVNSAAIGSDAGGSQGQAAGRGGLTSGKTSPNLGRELELGKKEPAKEEKASEEEGRPPEASIFEKILDKDTKAEQ